MKPVDDEVIVLAGDVGGTKTNLGLFTIGKRRPRLLTLRTFPSREAAGLEELVQHFLELHPTNIASACFGIAGPVQNGRCKTTNLPWDVSENRIGRYFDWDKVRLINDLAAMALAIPLLNAREMCFLNRAKLHKGQNMGLVAPGTGLGMALLVYENEKYIPVPSEGGHADFGPNSEMEVELWHYLRQHFGHVSAERIVSGPGLLNIYSWLKGSERFVEPSWLGRNIKEMDPGKAITEGAMVHQNPLCLEALNTFVSILGAVAGNLALIGMTTGGMYLGGGIPPKILPKLEEDIFLKAFTNKGRFKKLVEQIPVRVILNDKASLLGAAHCAFEMTRFSTRAPLIE